MVLSRNTISDFELNFSFHVVHSFEKFHGSTTLYLKKDFSQLYFISNALQLPVGPTLDSECVPDILHMDSKVSR